MLNIFLLCAGLLLELKNLVSHINDLYWFLLPYHFMTHEKMWSHILGLAWTLKSNCYILVYMEVEMDILRVSFLYFIQKSKIGSFLFYLSYPQEYDFVCYCFFERRSRWCFFWWLVKKKKNWIITHARLLFHRQALCHITALSQKTLKSIFRCQSYKSHNCY